MAEALSSAQERSFDIVGAVGPGERRDSFVTAARILRGLVQINFLGDESLPVAVLGAVQFLRLNGVDDVLGQAELGIAARAAAEGAAEEAVVGLLHAALETGPRPGDTELQRLRSPAVVGSRLHRGDGHTMAGFKATFGYEGLRRALTQMTPEAVRAEVLASGLTGRSGAQPSPPVPSGRPSPRVRSGTWW